ncbi:MAG: DUF3127 domain-containing protein [Bacteroidales bacterium]|nr:DUF3127 domain-containing protein [Bacteroidales bacterium]
MNFELSGKLIKVYDEVQVNDRFKKREFVIEKEESGFSDQIKFQLIQDKTSLIDGFSVGSEINVSFNVRGNKWKDAYFVNLQAWRIQAVGNAAVSTPAFEPPDEELPPLPDEEDDLPF